MLYKASKNIPELKREIRKAEIGYTKLRTLLPALEKKREENKNDDIKSLIEETKTTTRKKLEKIVRDIAPLPDDYNKPSLPLYMGKGRIKRVAVLTSEQEVLLDKAMTLLSSEARKNLSFEEFLELASRKIVGHKLKSGNKKALIVTEKDSVTTKSFGELEINKEKLITPGGEVKNKRPGRNIPSKIKEEVVKRDGTKCKICAGTGRDLEFHHTRAFSEKKEHDARCIILICRSCHSLIHEGYLKVAFDQNNRLLIRYMDKEVLTFTDYLFKKKKELYLKEKYLPKLKLKKQNTQPNLTFNF